MSTATTRVALRSGEGMTDTESVDLVILGAGPAGMAAGIAAKKAGVAVRVLEQGAPLESRNQTDAHHLVSGVGGAGLYSDGKFSFFPSASSLWDLEPTTTLLESFESVRTLIAATGRHDVSDSMVFPPEQLVRQQPGPVIQKRYPSYYLSPLERSAIVRTMQTELGSWLSPNTQVTGIRHLGDSLSVVISHKYGDRSRIAEIDTTAMVVASGRFGPLELQSMLPSLPLVGKRFELGIRIEQPTETFFLRDDRSLDPKLIVPLTSDMSVRTFCCCRDGRVIVTSFQGLKTVSGRADCPPTGWSNVGLLARLARNPEDEEWLHLISALRDTEPVRVELKAFLRDQVGDIVDVLGRDAVDALRKAVEVLGTKYPDLYSPETWIHSPAFEGLWRYPVVDDELRVTNWPIWVAGDCTGRFRGIVAALLSGHVAGINASKATAELGRQG